MSLLTSKLKWPLLPLPLPSKSPTNSLTVKSSPSVMNVSVAQNLSSSHPSWVWNPAVSMKPSTTPSCVATLISVRISMPTTFFLVVPPCTLVLLTECRRKSLLLLHPPLRSRSLLHQSENTPYGLVALFLLLSLLSRPCGSPKKNTTNLAQELSTESASKHLDYLFLLILVYVWYTSTTFLDEDNFINFQTVP